MRRYYLRWMLGTALAASLPACGRDHDPGESGFDVLPTRLVRGQGTALVIDPPVSGQQRVYRTGTNMEGLYSSTVTTIGADFSTGDD